MVSIHPKRLSKSDKMSDVAFAQEIMREAFPRSRHGSVKAAIYAAFRFVQPRVQKEFTVRRARSIWEGTARRIDAEEKDALILAQIEEARREQRDLRQRLARLDIALADLDENFSGSEVAAHREAAARLGRLGCSGDRGDAR